MNLSTKILIGVFILAALLALVEVTISGMFMDEYAARHGGH